MLENIAVGIVKWDVDWFEIKNLYDKIIGNNDDTINPSRGWKRRLLLSEDISLKHSLIGIEIDNIPPSVRDDLLKYFNSGVSYKIGDDDNTLSLQMDLDILSLIQISRQALCNQSNVVTKKTWLKVMRDLVEYDDDIVWACVPEGIRTCGCPKLLNTCYTCENIIEPLDFMCRTDLISRYDYYDEFRKKELVK